MKLFYSGHPINTYGTELEEQLLQQIAQAFPGWKIENPNQKHHRDKYAHWKRKTGNGMNYFIQQVLPNCCGGIFLPFRDGAWGAGVFKEVEVLVKKRLRIWKLTLDGVIDRSRSCYRGNSLSH